MKTLLEHTILYDDECPMCDLYTRGFVKSNMLDANGRVAYGKISPALAATIDGQRACNEIALVDRRTGNVTYGVESLFTIIANRFPIFKSLFSYGPFRTAMKYFYAFISFNRKVIAPGKKFEAPNSCTPHYHLGYRWAYIVFAWLVTSFILNAYAQHLTDFLSKGNFWREFLVCGGQVAFQSAMISFLRRDRIVHYLGNMMTISFGGALLLLVMLVVEKFLAVPSILYLGWFAFTVGLMFLEHLRRVKYLEIHWSASAGWVLYRVLVLLIIFYLDSL